MVHQPLTDRIDPRCTRSQQRVLAAAVELLREEGLHGLTFEAVAARSGVAKTTIYRHYADREAMHLAAVESVGPAFVMPISDDLLADFTAFLEALNHTLHHSDFGAILLTALDGAERSARVEHLARTAANQRRSIVITRLENAQRAGRIVDDADLELVCDELVGPLFYRRFMSRQPASAAFVARLTNDVLAPLLRPAAATPP